MERYDNAVKPFWTAELYAKAHGTTDAAALAAEHLQKIGAGRRGSASSRASCRRMRGRCWASGCRGRRFVDATGVLERLRGVKTPAELAKLRQGSELITDAMLAVIGWAREGTTKAEIIERLRREEVARGLHFDYCLLTLGASHNRAPSPQAWAPGEVLSIDSGGNSRRLYRRSGADGGAGRAGRELEDLLGEIEAVQQAAFAEVRAGGSGGASARGRCEVMRAGPNGGVTDFFVHGMGLISHEVPFLMDRATTSRMDAGRPLEVGMVLSVETTMHHPRRGFIKLEDTVAVTADGFEMFGEAGRGWNRGGTQA